MSSRHPRPAPASADRESDGPGVPDGADAGGRSPAVESLTDAAALIGRSGVVKDVVHCLRDEGRAGALIIGGAGSGKTVVVKAVLAELRPPGTVIRLAATPALASVRFGALTPYLAGLPDHDLDSYAAVLGAVTASLRSEPALALFVIDDAQNLDRGTIQLIAQAVATGAARLLAASRPGPLVPEEFLALWGDGLISKFDLAPLSRAEVHQLCEQVLRSDVSPWVSELFAKLTAGNPFMLMSLIEHARTTGAIGQRRGTWFLLAPPELGNVPAADLVDHQVRAMSPEEKTAAAVVALAGPLSLGQILRFSSPRAVDALEMAGIITVSTGPGPHRQARQPADRRDHPPPGPGGAQREPQGEPAGPSLGGCGAPGGLPEPVALVAGFRRGAGGPGAAGGSHPGQRAPGRRDRAPRRGCHGGGTLPVGGQDPAGLRPLHPGSSRGRGGRPGGRAADTLRPRVLSCRTPGRPARTLAAGVEVPRGAGRRRTGPRRRGSAGGGGSNRGPRLRPPAGGLGGPAGRAGGAGSSELVTAAESEPEIRIPAVSRLAAIWNAQGRVLAGLGLSREAWRGVHEDGLALPLVYEDVLARYCLSLIRAGEWEELASVLDDYSSKLPSRLLYSGGLLHVMRGYSRLRQGRVPESLAELLLGVEELLIADPWQLAAFARAVTAYAASAVGHSVTRRSRRKPSAGPPTGPRKRFGSSRRPTAPPPNRPPAGTRRRAA